MSIHCLSFFSVLKNLKFNPVPVAGKEIISEIEQLQVDKKNRPLVDARIFNAGELVPKSKVSKYVRVMNRPLGDTRIFKAGELVPKYKVGKYL